MRRLGFTLKSSQVRLATIVTEESSQPAKASTQFIRSKAGWLVNETWQGALILAALLLCFFSTPLSRLPDSHYSVADVLQVYTLAKVNVPLTGLSNTLLSDTFQANQPWTFFNRDSI